MEKEPIALTETQLTILTKTSNESAALLAAYKEAEIRRTQALQLVCDAHNIPVPEKAIIKDGLLIIEE